MPFGINCAYKNMHENLQKLSALLPCSPDNDNTVFSFFIVVLQRHAPAPG
jgi:hypothetical protein